MKKLLIIPFILTLAACNSAGKPELVQTKLAVVTPPEEMYVCPVEKKYPHWQTLNDVEVAKTIVKLYKNNVTCKRSLDTIKAFLEKSKAEIED